MTAVERLARFVARAPDVLQASRLVLGMAKPGMTCDGCVPRRRVWTIGHGTRPIDDLIATLDEADVETLVDVRRFPAQSARRSPAKRC
jgi:hypothetical protein